MLNQATTSYPMAVDAADTLYVSQSNLNMYSATNNYATPITDIGIVGYPGSVSLAPDGTIYVVGGDSTMDIIDRSQGSINWGSNNGAVSSQQTVTLYNGGNQPLTISSIVPNGGAGYTVAPATSNGCATNGITLAPGTVCLLLVTSTPPHAGTLTGSIAITGNSLNEPGTVQTVALTGYTSGIWVAATPNPYVFPKQTLGTTSVPLPVTVTNTSAGSTAVGYGSTVAITSGFTSTNPAFAASLGDPTAPTYCGNPLVSGSTCLIQVTFNPSQATNYSGTISWTEQITGGGPSMKVSFAVSGNGTPAPLLIPVSETVHFTDSALVTPSLLIPVSETVNVSDSDAPVPSLLIPVSETIHFADTPVTNLSQATTPTITSVSAIASRQAQTPPITISGSGFGTHTAYTGDSSYIELVDSTGTPWTAGHTGNSVALAVSSWSDSQIVLTGLSGNYGLGGWCIRPGDQLSVRVWNAQSGNGPAVYPIVATGTDACAPTITSVSPIVSQETQTITISGAGFGAQAAYTGDSSYINLLDSTGSAAPWGAGEAGNSVTLAVSSWTDTQIVLTGLSGDYNIGGWCIHPGDQLSVRIWNANTGHGPATYPIVATGADTCAPKITSVSPILPQQTQTITIGGSGFGSQAAYTGDSSYINLVDTTGNWDAGNSGNGGNAVTLTVSSWTDSQIVLTGFSAAYGKNGWCIKPGDQLSVRVWNANTGAGPAIYPIAASSGTNTCP
jgi:protein involved in polysaccharide export with SLBB domain